METRFTVFVIVFQLQETMITFNPTWDIFSPNLHWLNLLHSVGVPGVYELQHGLSLLPHVDPEATGILIDVHPMVMLLVPLVFWVW